MQTIVVATQKGGAGAAVDVLKVADRVVIPLRPSFFDLGASKPTIDLARKTPGCNALLVLWGCPARVAEGGMARAALELAGLPIARTEIGLRTPFVRSAGYGQGVVEFEPNGKSAAEINQLLDEVLA